MKLRPTQMRLVECTDIKTGFPFKSAQYVEQGIKLLRGDNVVQGNLRWENVKCWPETDAASFEDFSLRSGDTVLAMDRPWIEAGLKIARIAASDLPSLLVQRVARLRALSVVDADFLYFSLRSASFTEYVLSIQTGTAVPHISSSQIGQYVLNLPSLDEQRGIGQLLSALESRVALLRETNETLEAMARAIFKSWFVDFDPVRAKAEGREPEGMDAATAALFPSEFQDSELGPIPRGWRLGHLSEIVAVNPVRTLRKGETAPYLDMSNVPTAGPSISDVVDRPLGSGCKFVNGDTLLAKITPCLENGKTAFVDFLQQNEVGWGSTELIVLAPIDPVPPVLGYLLARDTSFRSFAEQSMTGTSGRQRVPPDQLKRFGMVISEDAVYRAFGAAVIPMFDSITANAERMKTLSALRDTLLPRLISGKLRVPEAAAMLAEAL